MAPRPKPRSPAPPLPSASLDREGAWGASFVPAIHQPSGAPPPTRVESRAQFLLKAHPERWTIQAGAIVPLFGRVVLEPGVNGTETVRRRAPDGSVTTTVRLGSAKQFAEDTGWTIIPYDAIPDHHVRPGQAKSYLWRPEGRPDVCLLIYERCFPGSEHVEQDTARYLEFCQHLQDIGLVSPPPLYILRRMREAWAKRLGAALDKAEKNANARPIADHLTREIAVIDRAIAEREATAAPVTAGEALEMPA